MLTERLDQILSAVEKPARYIGNEINAIHKPEQDVNISVALAFPDVYEIGTSYLGFQILYDILNKLPEVQAERVFAPWPDMEAKLREYAFPLFGLESKRPLTEMDMVGFTLQYELSYTNILNMLDLACIPPRAEERNGMPLIVAGGPGAYNPEPLAEFIDAFIIGEGEEVIIEFVGLLARSKQFQWSRKQLLVNLAKTEGIYVPRFYQPVYSKDGHYAGTRILNQSVPERIRKRIVRDFSLFPLPENIIVPLVQPVHDRVSLEICRGCARSCRFCQAGMVYRPVRERKSDLLHEQGKNLLARTGSSELSLSSLSSADYTGIEKLLSTFLADNTSVSLPSLRVDSYSVRLAELTRAVRKTGLTLAPEAGTQRLRDVINKNVSEEDILSAARSAYISGWTTIKLYFMIGLPTETRADVVGIIDLVHKLQALYREVGSKSKRLQINLGVSTFVPKAHTPFQWSAQLDKGEVEFRQNLLHERLQAKNIKVQTTRWRESYLEAALARGDRRVGQVIFAAWQAGCRFDAWTEHFCPDLWQQAFINAGIEPGEYVNCNLPFEQVLPWDHIDSGISKKFLVREAVRAQQGELTADCTFSDCHGCGICAAYAIKPWQREGEKCD